MKDILQITFWDNTVALYLQVFGTILVALILKHFISKYFASLIFKIFYKKEQTAYKKSFIELIVGPLELFIFLIIIAIALDKLTLPHFLNFTFYKISTKQLLDAIANTAFIVVFIRLCLRLVKFVSLVFEDKANLTISQSDNQLVIFFRDFFRALIYIAGFLMILHFTFHYDISKLVTGLSIVGAAVALATKESLENLIASFIIFFDKPLLPVIL
jgi:MscS family membrane protein